MSDFVIIPAYNEGKDIEKVIIKTKKYTKNIVVVDDGSGDDTSQRAKECGALTLKHKINLGKGAALKTGCDYALQQGAKKIIAMDADGQHDPREVPLLLSKLNEVDIVFGYRKVPQSMPLVLQFGNTVINKTMQLLYRIRVHDSQCGYRAFTDIAYQQVRWDALDYYVETEMIIRAGKKKLKYCWIPIETIYSDKYKGTTVIDGMMIVAKMIGWRLWR